MLFKILGFFLIFMGSITFGFICIYAWRETKGKRTPSNIFWEIFDSIDILELSFLLCTVGVCLLTC